MIRLKAMCKGMYASDGGPGWRYDACATRILDIERGFRSFIREPGAFVRCADGARRAAMIRRLAATRVPVSA